jgi:hypothetical protein
MPVTLFTCPCPLAARPPPPPVPPPQFQAMSLIGYAVPSTYDDDASKFKALLVPGGGPIPGGSGAGAPPPAAGTNVVTGVTLLTGGASCRKNAQTVALRAGGGDVKALTLCARTGAYPGETSTRRKFKFVSNLVVASKAGADGAKPPPISSVACPDGHKKIRKNLRAGVAPAAGGAATTAVLCYKVATNATAEAPLTSVTAVASPDACGDQITAFGDGSPQAGEAVNMAEGTSGPASYVCLLH